MGLEKEHGLESHTGYILVSWLCTICVYADDILATLCIFCCDVIVLCAISLYYH